MKPESIKLLEENIGRTLWHKSQQVLFDPPPRVMEIKTKINQWDLVKHKSFCTARGKENLQNRRKYLQTKQLMIALQNIQAAHAAQYQKNEPNQNMGRRSKQTLLQRNIYRWPTNTWKDAQHHSLLREMQIKTTVRYHLIPVRTVIVKNTTNI